MEAPRWYTAVFVVSCSVACQDDEPLVDLQHHLIKAADDESAYQQALALGSREAQTYQNSDGRAVSWMFDGLHDLVELDAPPEDGSEVYSRIVRAGAGNFVTPKERLTCFWAAGHGQLTARDLLSGDIRPGVEHTSIEIGGPVFHSPKDEDCFFTWLRTITGVIGVSGHGTALRIVVDAARLDTDGLRDLIALHQRYGIAIKQLQSLETSGNSAWFRNPNAHWFDSAFS